MKQRRPHEPDLIRGMLGQKVAEKGGGVGVLSCHEGTGGVEHKLVHSVLGSETNPKLCGDVDVGVTEEILGDGDDVVDVRLRKRRRRFNLRSCLIRSCISH